MMPGPTSKQIARGQSQEDRLGRLCASSHCSCEKREPLVSHTITLIQVTVQMISATSLIPLGRRGRSVLRLKLIALMTRIVGSTINSQSPRTIPPLGATFQPIQSQQE